ncbi:hypothetical protein TNCV_1360131 [Trichonephila clavipes]|nr:hypothetical protein TNCV_1360131 [Trichonephila clavipes]
MGISDRSMRRITKMEHGMKHYKLRKAQLVQTRTDLRMPKTFEKVRAGRDSFTLMRCSLRFNKFITPKTMVSGLWTL